MARVFPSEITAVDVAGMLATLDGKMPYFEHSDGREMACFDFDTPDVTICFVLPNREYDALARQALEEAIVLLPRFHERVAKMWASEPDNEFEEIELGLMEVEGDAVLLNYCFVRVNATPDFFFSKACHGGPLRPVAFAPEWRTYTAVTLARQMNESEDFSAMPILADALEEAGCDNSGLLAHCRGSGPHLAGCFVLDLVLARA